MKTIQNNSIIRYACLCMLTFALIFSATSTVSAQDAGDFRSALKQLPDSKTRTKLKPSTRALLDNTRALYQQGLQIDNMTGSEKESFSQALSANQTQLTSAVAGDPSCIQTCVNEREQCILDRCGPGTTFPCFCCIPCNLIFDLCVFDCLVDIEIGISVGKAAK